MHVMQVVANLPSMMGKLYHDSFALFVVAFVGLLYSLSFSVKFLSIIYRYMIRPRKNFLQIYGKGYAVVTGASKGIGLQYAHYLASLGFNVILIARSKILLEEQCKIIIKKYRVEAISISFDFSCSPSEISYTPIIKALQDKDISMLINNAGILECSPFSQLSIEKIKSQAMVNAGATTALCKIVIEKMLKRNGKSAIVNVGSISSDILLPPFSEYGATKSYIEIMSKSMEIDYRGKIDIMCVKFGPVYTDMGPMWIPGSITAYSAAKQSLSQLGYESIIYGHWLHELIALCSLPAKSIITRMSNATGKLQRYFILKWQKKE